MDEKYAKRIQQLLNKAESTTPEEAEALTAAAEKLMIKYGISRAMAEAAGEVPTEKIVERTYVFSGMWQTAWFNGFQTVVRAMGLRPLILKSNGVTTMYVIGFEKDVDEAITLITSLQTQSIVAQQHWWKTQGLQEAKWCGWTNHQRHVERRSFIESFGYGVAARIENERNAQVTEAGGGTELVLLDRAKLVDDYVDLGLKPRTTVRRGHALGHSGSAHGFDAGLEARNNKSVEQRKALA